MMGKIWESAIRATKKPLNISDLPVVYAALALSRGAPSTTRPHLHRRVYPSKRTDYKAKIADYSDYLFALRRYENPAHSSSGAF